MGLRHLLLRALPALLVMGLGGCEVIVSGKVTSIQCTGEGAFGPPGCLDGQVCRGGTCVEQGVIEKALGTSCESDADCKASDFCLDPRAYGIDGPKRCSRACCSSSGCDPDQGFACWTPTEGDVSFCLAASDMGRDPPGALGAGEPCQKGSDCRSGRCDDGACVDECCSDTGCAGAQGTCQFGARGADHGFFCAPPRGGRAFFEACNDDGDCASDLCLDFGGGIRRCSSPCCSSASCSTYVSHDPPMPIACTDVPHEGHVVRACAMVLVSTKVNAVGQPCAADSECRSGRCTLPADGQGKGYCSDACCSDASCGEGGALACRPAPFSSAWALRCEPR